MRGLIAFSGGLFVLLGALILGLSIFAMSQISEFPNDPTGMTRLGLLALTACGGMFGVTTVLVGGTAYLLASIDTRLEVAIKTLVRPSTETRPS